MILCGVDNSPGGFYRAIEEYSKRVEVGKATGLCGSNYFICIVWTLVYFIKTEQIFSEVRSNI